MLSCPRCPVVKCVRHRGDDVCCSVVFGILVGVFVLSSVYECQRVECAFTSPVRTKCGMFVMYCMQCRMSVSAVL